MHRLHDSYTAAITHMCAGTGEGNALEGGAAAQAQLPPAAAVTDPALAAAGGGAGGPAGRRDADTGAGAAAGTGASGGYYMLHPASGGYVLHPASAAQGQGSVHPPAMRTLAMVAGLPTPTPMPAAAAAAGHHHHVHSGTPLPLPVAPVQQRAPPPAGGGSGLSAMSFDAAPLPSASALCAGEEFVFSPRMLSLEGDGGTSLDGESDAVRAGTCAGASGDGDGDGDGFISDDMFASCFLQARPPP